MYIYIYIYVRTLTQYMALVTYCLHEGSCEDSVHFTTHQSSAIYKKENRAHHSKANTINIVYGSGAY